MRSIVRAVSASVGAHELIFWRYASVSARSAAGGVEHAATPAAEAEHDRRAPTRDRSPIARHGSTYHEARVTRTGRARPCVARRLRIPARAPCWSACSPAARRVARRAAGRSPSTRASAARTKMLRPGRARLGVPDARPGLRHRRARVTARRGRSRAAGHRSGGGSRSPTSRIEDRTPRHGPLDRTLRDGAMRTSCAQISVVRLPAPPGHEGHH